VAIIFIMTSDMWIIRFVLTYSCCLDWNFFYAWCCW